MSGIEKNDLLEVLVKLELDCMDEEDLREYYKDTRTKQLATLVKQEVLDAIKDYE